MADLQTEVARLRQALATANAGSVEAVARQVQATAQHAREHWFSNIRPIASEMRSRRLHAADLVSGASRATVIPNESRLRAIVESAVDHAIITADFQDRITSWNSGATRLLGWEEADVLGRPCRLIFTPEDCAAGVPQAEMQRHWKKAARSTSAGTFGAMEHDFSR